MKFWDVFKAFLERKFLEVDHQVIENVDFSVNSTAVNWIITSEVLTINSPDGSIWNSEKFSKSSIDLPQSRWKADVENKSPENSHWSVMSVWILIEGLSKTEILKTMYRLEVCLDSYLIFNYLDIFIILGYYFSIEPKLEIPIASIRNTRICINFAFFWKEFLIRWLNLQVYTILKKLTTLR